MPSELAPLWSHGWLRDARAVPSPNFGPRPPETAVTLAVIVGTIWAFIETGTRWVGEAKITISFVTWGFYLLMLFLRVSAGWRGRKAAVLALVVVGFAAATWAAHVGLRPLLAK